MIWVRVVLLKWASRFRNSPLFLLPDGFWTFAHAARLGIAMLLTTIFVIYNGSGMNSLDEKYFGN
jgi:hypothetical protein